jgi:hypothetical protein
MPVGIGGETGDASIDEVVAQFEEAGHTGQMAARAGGRLLCFTCRVASDATAVGLVALRRMEGASDPADMLAVAALTCPNCGAKATVVLGYGPESSEDDSDVLVELDGRHTG